MTVIKKGMFTKRSEVIKILKEIAECGGELWIYPKNHPEYESAEFVSGRMPLYSMVVNIDQVYLDANDCEKLLEDGYIKTLHWFGEVTDAVGKRWAREDIVGTYIDNGGDFEWGDGIYFTVFLEDLVGFEYEFWTYLGCQAHPS